MFVITTDGLVEFDFPLDNAEMPIEFLWLNQHSSRVRDPSRTYRNTSTTLPVSQQFPCPTLSQPFVNLLLRLFVPCFYVQSWLRSLPYPLNRAYLSPHTFFPDVFRQVQCLRPFLAHHLRDEQSYDLRIPSRANTPTHVNPGAGVARATGSSEEETFDDIWLRWSVRYKLLIRRHFVCFLEDFAENTLRKESVSE